MKLCHISRMGPVFLNTMYVSSVLLLYAFERRRNSQDPSLSRQRTTDSLLPTKQRHNNIAKAIK